MRPFLLFALGFMASPALAADPMTPIEAGLSATKARDINGFTLGLPVKEAAKRLKVEFVQGELVQGSLDGIRYAFGVCPSGRIYRIESSQPLGRFTVDKTFTDGMGAKLFAKYGLATGGDPDNLYWDLIEPVRYTDGKVHPFKTNWAAAIVSSSGADGVSLDLKMIDFRICWADAISRNSQPRDEATQAIRF